MLATAGITTGLGLDVDTAIDVADNALTHNWMQVALAAAELGIEGIEEHREDVIDYLKGATDYAENDISEAVDYLITGGKILSKATDLLPGKAAVKAPSKAVLKGVKTALKAEKSPVKGVVKKVIRNPASIQDKMTLDAAKKGAGEKLPINLKDPKYKDMEKWEYKVKSKDGKDSVVHYVRDPKTGKLMDFKFKKRSID